VTGGRLGAGGDLRLADPGLAKASPTASWHGRLPPQRHLWNDHPDYRAEQAYIRVLHLPAPGMSHRERAVLAMALAYRYKSDPGGACSTPPCTSDSKSRTYARRSALASGSPTPSGGRPPAAAGPLRRTDRNCGWCRPAPRAAWAT
jgi:hypothetical protein